VNLAPKDLLGPYEILSVIGAGGMGEVYRARDTRLKRDVAIKVLSAHTLDDPHARSRFEHEARAASALNHANIITVHDVGIASGMPYIVSELVEGESLRSFLQRGPIPIKKLFDLSTQIADGLAAAHKAGIVHRDLKPENIMLTWEGRVKILDFGLAKSPPDATASEAETRTRTGDLKGTIPYMSPEQARGTPVDLHSDQFSFGLILFEMATGKHPFRRESPVQTLAALIQEDLPRLRDELPAPFQWVVERCLAKQPQQRYGSTIDLYYDLRNLRDHSPERMLAGTTALSDKKAKSKVPLAVAGGILAALIGGFAGALWVSGPVSPSYSYTPVATETAAESFPAWSPDGKTIAYSGEVEGIYQIFTRSLGSPMPSQITKVGSDGLYPFWSSDGTHIFYTSGGPKSLWSVSAVGGEPEIVVKDVTAAAMSPDGNTLAFIRQGIAALWISSTAGNNVRKIADLPAFGVDGFIRFSPDGRKIAAWIGNQNQFSQVWTFPFPGDGVEGKQVGQSWERQFLRGARPFSWMPDSRRIVFEGQTPGTSSVHLWMADVQSGSLQPVTASNTEEAYPAVSPDGKRIAFIAAPSDFDLVEIPIDGGPMRPLIATPRYESWPAWSPVGKQLAYTAVRNGAYEIWLADLQNGVERPLITGKDFGNELVQFLAQPSFSPDGRRIAYQRFSAESSAIWVSTVEGGPPIQLAPEPDIVRQDSPAWSPDGNWIAYVSTRGDQHVLAKVRPGGSRPPVNLKDVVGRFVQWSPRGNWISCITKNGFELISSDGQTTQHLSNTIPLAHGWSKDGAFVYGVKSDDRRRLLLFSIEIRTGHEKTVTDLGPAPIAAVPYQTGIGVRGLSLAPDGKSFAASILRSKSDIWILEGFEAGGLWARLGRRR
jgi:serine/threonine protein kinase